jgi:hypothetical protein
VSATAEQATLLAHHSVPLAGAPEPPGAVAPSAPPERAAISAANAGQHAILLARQAAARRQAQQAAARQRAAAEQAAAQQAQAQQQAQQAATQQAAAGSPQQIALNMLAKYGWSSSQFSCLDSLWQEESGWNVYASNPASGAYGIPQALPGSKMASAGPDWESDATTQIAWGLSYIQSTYGSPCAAWDHEEADGWY